MVSAQDGALPGKALLHLDLQEAPFCSNLLDHIGSHSSFAVRTDRPKWPGCFESMAGVWSLHKTERFQVKPCCIWICRKLRFCSNLLDHIGSHSSFAVRTDRPKWPGCFESMAGVWSLHKTERFQVKPCCIWICRKLRSAPTC